MAVIQFEKSTIYFQVDVLHTFYSKLRSCNTTIEKLVSLDANNMHVYLINKRLFEMGPISFVPKPHDRYKDMTKDTFAILTP